MTITGLALKNVLRKKGRTVLTVCAIAASIVLFILMRTVVASWENAADYAAQDRIGTRHKVTFVMTLPKKYVEDVKNVPGVEAATFSNWFGGKDPNHPQDFFATIAVDVPTFLDVYPELVAPPEQIEAWKAERRGALVGDQIAKKFGWKIGQRIVLQGTIFPGDWEFIVSGIYTTTSKALDRSTLWFHWDYLNDSPVTRNKDQIGWISSRVSDAGSSAAVSKAIDATFEARDTQTLTMSEKAMQQDFMGMFAAILKGIDYVTIAILAIIALILGNTIAMSVRERTSEYGALRAIGFRPRHIVQFVAAETIATGALGGLVGLGVAYLFVGGLLGPFIEENMGAMFPSFGISGPVAIAAIVVSIATALVAALLPAIRAARLDVVTALRTLE